MTTSRKGTRWATCEGANERVYRSPYFDGTREAWRFRVADPHTGKIETHSIDISGRGPREPGKLSRRKASRKEAADAVRELAELERKAAEQKKLEPERREPTCVTLKAALEEWLGVVVTQETRPSTAKEYGYCAAVYRDHLGDGAIVRDIDFAAIEKLFSTWLRNRSVRTRIKHLAFLKRFFRWCENHCYCRGNPAAKLAESDMEAWKRKARPRRGKALTHEECVKLLEAARGTYARDTTPEALEAAGGKRVIHLNPPAYLFPLLAMAMKAGLRRGNLIGSNGIRWRDLKLDGDKPTLHIDGGRMKWETEEGFTAPLHPEVVEALKAWRKAQGRLPRAAAPVFHVREWKGKKRTQSQAIERPFRAALERAGLDKRGLRFHDLRHTFISRLEEIAPDGIVKFLSHHSRSGITGVYSHVDTEKAREYLDKLPRFFPKEAAEMHMKEKA